MASIPPQGQPGFTPGYARPTSSDATVALVIAFYGVAGPVSVATES